MTKITVGLTLRMIFVPNQMIKFVLMGPNALREPKMCPWGMLCALKELKVNDEYVHGCDVSGYDVLVLSRSR